MLHCVQIRVPSTWLIINVEIVVTTAKYKFRQVVSAVLGGLYRHLLVFLLQFHFALAHCEYQYAQLGIVSNPREAQHFVLQLLGDAQIRIAVCRQSSSGNRYNKTPLRKFDQWRYGSSFDLEAVALEAGQDSVFHVVDATLNEQFSAKI